MYLKLLVQTTYLILMLFPLKLVNAQDAITTPSGFVSGNGLGGSIYADFLYLEASQSNLGFVKSGIANAIASPTTQGQTTYPSFQYQPGFKIGIASQLGHDNWDIDFNYTWLNGTSLPNSVYASYDTSTLRAGPTIYSPSLTDDFQLVQSDGIWYFIYNLSNLNIGRNYLISPNLTLHPHFGITTAWNHQAHSIHYLYENLDAVDTPAYFISEEIKQKFIGTGFNYGINVGWLLNTMWSFYGDFNLFNLFSKYDIDQKETQYPYTIETEVTDYLDPTVNFNVSKLIYAIQNIIDIQIGVRWSMRFFDNKIGTTVQIGWDQQIWIDHGLYSHVPGNLSLQGLDFKFKFDF